MRPGLNEKWLMVAMPQHPRLRITATEELAKEEKGGAHLELIWYLKLTPELWCYTPELWCFNYLSATLMLIHIVFTFVRGICPRVGCVLSIVCFLRQLIPSFTAFFCCLTLCPALRCTYSLLLMESEFILIRKKKTMAKLHEKPKVFFSRTTQESCVSSH